MEIFTKINRLRDFGSTASVLGFCAGRGKERASIIFTVAPCALILSSLFYPTDTHLNIVFTFSFALKFPLKAHVNVNFNAKLNANIIFNCASAG